ncbi:MAG: flagellar biosynthetic protein FliR [Bacillota bacterium]
MPGEVFGLGMDRFALFLLVFTRATAFVSVCPVFSARMVPPLVKAGLGLMLALAALPLVPAAPAPTDHWLSLSLAILSEVAVGLGLGLFVSLVFFAAQVAGSLVGLQMGLAMAEFIDPSSGGHSVALAQFFYLWTLVLFLTLNGHHALIEGLVKSIGIIPLGHGVLTGELTLFVIHKFAEMFVIALKIVGPLIAILFTADAVMGLMSRLVPQMNVFMLGFPIKIFAGFMIIMLTAPLINWLLQKTFSRLSADYLTVIRYLGG